jgi:hypothetical protein
MRLWLVNLDPETTDDELRDLVRRIARLEVASLTRVPGDGVRTAVLLEFASASQASVEYAQQRLNGLHWKHRSLTAYVPGMKK